MREAVAHVAAPVARGTRSHVARYSVEVWFCAGKISGLLRVSHRHVRRRAGGVAAQCAHRPGRMSHSGQGPRGPTAQRERGALPAREEQEGILSPDDGKVDHRDQVGAEHLDRTGPRDRPQRPCLLRHAIALPPVHRRHQNKVQKKKKS